MNAIILSLLTNTGAAGDGTEAKIVISHDGEMTTGDLIKLFGRHNILSIEPSKDSDTLVLRGWQTETDVPLPQAEQLLAALDAAEKARLRVEAERSAAIERDRQDARGKLGDNLAKILDGSILDAHPITLPYTLNTGTQWIVATATDETLIADLEKIRQPTRSRGKHAKGD